MDVRVIVPRNANRRGTRGCANFGHAYTDIAIDQAYRAVTELFGRSASGDPVRAEARGAI